MAPMESLGREEEEGGFRFWVEDLYVGHARGESEKKKELFSTGFEEEVIENEVWNMSEVREKRDLSQMDLWATMFKTWDH